MAVVALSLSVFLLLVASQRVVADRLYTVVADESPSSCSGNKTECSLMYYAAHPDEYFRENNTTFHFLPGEHELVNRTHVLMANVSNLTLYGTGGSEVRIVCSGEYSGGFSFYNITNLTIMNLSLHNCSYWSKYKELIALEIIQTYNVRLDNIDIWETPGVGLSLSDLYGDSFIEHTTVEFSHNTSNSRGGNLAYYCSRFHKNNTAIDRVNVSNSFFRNGVNIHDFYSSEGGGVHIEVTCSARVEIVFDNVSVVGNHAKSGGNVFITLNEFSSMWTASVYILNSRICNGSANSGGGLCMIAIGGGNGSHEIPSTILKVENTHFYNNTAYYNGGAVYMRLHQNSTVAIGTIEFTENCTFTNNKLAYSSSQSHGGVAVHIVTYILPQYDQHKTVFFKVEFSNCTFQHNFQQQTRGSSASLPRTGTLYAENVRSTAIENCKFVDNVCSGIVGINSNFLLHGENEISGNRALKGGGIFFCASSMMHLYNGTQLYITNNSADISGGGIYVDGECSPAVAFCFFQVDNVTADNATLRQTQVHLINNTAGAGSALYGGIVDWCVLFDKRGQKYKHSYPAKIFNNTFHIQQKDEDDLSVISSDPIYIGFCKINMSISKLPNCQLNTRIEVTPGKRFSVSAILMGQRHGLVSGVVVAECVEDDCSIPSQEYSQYINASNSKRRYLAYTVSSRENRSVSLKLLAEDYYSGFPTYQYQPSYINITVERCPIGFIERKEECSCLPHIPCNITSQTIYRSSPHWIGYKECCTTNTTAIIFHSFCPLGHCLDKDVHIGATVYHFDQDVQCARHRTGLLCGQCKQNFSLGFGSSQCLDGCNTAHSYLQYLRVIGLMAVCGVAGVLLVVLLTLLNLTVAEGTLNGLIFYANIVQVNQDIFFPSDIHARPWTVFIAWLNLDFGVTVCFYDGMDAYVKTWLQFIFPLYLWIVSGGIVYFSRKSRKVAKLAGKNSVKVLATLFLLSFGKLIRTVIAAGFFTNVKSYDGTIRISVWLLDANVRYLHGKHITLFVAASVAGGVVLLYAVTLTFIQCLRRAPNSRMCGWVGRLKPLLDAYTGPYKDRYHFWTGLLLLVRITLFTSFALNFNNNPTLNFTLIITVSSLLILGIQNGIYKNRLIGLLESSLYVNLILFSAFTMLSMKSSPTQKTAVVFVFGVWALLTLAGVICYHGHRHWFGNTTLSHLRMLFCARLKPRGNDNTTVQSLVVGGNAVSEVSEESDNDLEHELNNQPWSTPCLREPLIASIDN